MEQPFYTRLFCFILLFSFISPASAASDSSNIMIQITIDESMLPKKCHVKFEVNNQSLSSTTENNCYAGRNLLLEQVNQLVRQEISPSNHLKIVTVTITAP